MVSLPAAPRLPRVRLRLVWPLPALAAWAGCWALFAGLVALALPPAAAVLAASFAGVTAALAGSTRWRRVFIGTGFPLSFAASGLAGAVPAWAWLLPLALLVLLYPVHAWGDAPMFPTPAGALQGLAARVPLRPGALILDAGCGLGDGLRELHRAYPEARLLGLEWSWPLRLAGALRAPFATVRRADIWAADWSGCDMVYLFQRPESMPRAVEKAAAELKPGAWLASLEFESAALAPTVVHRCPDGRPVWLYRMPFRPAARASAAAGRDERRTRPG